MRLFGFRNVSLDTEAVSDFSAPELRRGQDYSCKADIWSLGITLMTIYVGLPQSRNGASYRDLKSHLAMFGQQCKSGMQFISHLLWDAPDGRLEGERLLEDDFLQNEPENADLSLPLTTPYEPYNGYDSDAVSLPDTLAGCRRNTTCENSRLRWYLSIPINKQFTHGESRTSKPIVRAAINQCSTRMRRENLPDEAETFQAIRLYIFKRWCSRS